MISLCASVFGGRTRTEPATGLLIPPPPLSMPAGRSREEHRVGRGGLAAWRAHEDEDLEPGPGLLGGSALLPAPPPMAGAALPSVTGVTGLAGCDKLCSGAWNVYTVSGGLWWPFSYAGN